MVHRATGRGRFFSGTPGALGFPLQVQEKAVLLGGFFLPAYFVRITRSPDWGSMATMAESPSSPA